MARGRKNNSLGCSIWLLLLAIVCSILNFITNHPFLTAVIVSIVILIYASIKTDLIERISVFIKNRKKMYELAGGTPALFHDFAFAVMAVIEAPRIWLQRVCKFHTFDEYYDLLSAATPKKETKSPISQDVSFEEQTIPLPSPHIEPLPEHLVSEKKERSNMPPINEEGQVISDQIYTVHETPPVSKTPDESVNEKSFPVLSPFAQYALNLGIKKDKIDGLPDEAIKPLVASRLKGGHKRKKNALFAYAVYCKVKKIPLGNLDDEPCRKDCEKFAYNLSVTAQKYVNGCDGGDRLFRPYPGSSAYNESLFFLHLVDLEGQKRE